MCGVLYAAGRAKDVVEAARCIISLRQVHLVDHHQVILLDPSSPLGYEMKRAALHEGGDYLNSVDAFEVMFKKIAESSDLSIQGDMCCINESDHTALQEVLVAMFKWYQQQLVALRPGLSVFGRGYVSLRPGRRRRWKMLHTHC